MVTFANKNQTGDVQMIIYFGRIAWGWRMYGIGYKSKWFLGFSIAVS